MGRLTPTLDLHLALGLERLDVRRDQHVSTQVYKGVNDLSTPFIYSLFQTVGNLNNDADDRRVTRAQTNNHVTIPHSDYGSGEKRFQVFGGISYNQKPPAVKNSPTLASYKRNVKKTGVIYQMLNP